MRVSMARHTLTAFVGRSSWCQSSSGPWHPTRSAGGTTPADRPWNCHHSPFHVLRTSLMLSRPGSVSASPHGSTSTAAWQEMDAAVSTHAATCTRRRPSEADIARERNLLQLGAIYLCDRFGISQDRKWNLDETAVRMVPAGERRWSKMAESTHVFASRAFVTVTLAATARGGMCTQIVYEEKTDRVQPHVPLFPRQLLSQSPTHWITQEALLDMIDAIDADMNARPGNAELTQHVAKEFRSIMRDTRSHIKLCFVQRNFTAYTQPLVRAYMRAFKRSRWPNT